MLNDRYVLVRAVTLDDHLDLVERAIARLDGVEPHDPLQTALRGTVAELRTHSLLEPTT